MERKGVNMANRRKRPRNIYSKKRKINYKKLIIAAVAVVLISFGIFKVGKGAFTTISAFMSKSFSTEQQSASGKQFDINEENQKQKKYTILVDAGHGGYDIGSESSKNYEGSPNNVYEKDIALQISKKVTAKLSQYEDVQVIMSRSDDTLVSLDDRTAIAASQNVDAFISIHLNAEAGGNSAYGVETYYRKNSEEASIELANMVQSSMVSYVQARDRGTMPANYEVLRETTMPAILIETGFISNPEEEKKLSNSKYQDQMAEGIAQGVLSYLDKINKK